MDSDDGNISDHVGDLDIQWYQFEPLCNDESQQEREHSTSEDSDKHDWTKNWNNISQQVVLMMIS